MSPRQLLARDAVLGCVVALVLILFFATTGEGLLRLLYGGVR